MDTNRRVFRVALASEDVESFLTECKTFDWYAVDTAERIMTDAGPDAEAVLLVGPMERAPVRHAAPIAH